MNPEGRRPAARAGSFDFRILGPVEVIRDGRPVELGGRRQHALLALLLLAGERGMGPEQLADELWLGSPPPGAQTTIRSYVSRSAMR